MRRLHALLFAGALLGAAALAADPPAPSTVPAPPCFQPGRFQSWSAPDDKTIVIQVQPRHFYRLDLASQCPALRWPDAHLVTRFDGTNMVCTALDWDLHVHASLDIPQACLVQRMTPLSPAQAAALPARSKP